MSGSPMDKAGSYGIQDDFGCTFVEKIVGDYFNIVGLPLLKTYKGLKKVLNKDI
jgi:septum formation protein